MRTRIAATSPLSQQLDQRVQRGQRLKVQPIHRPWITPISPRPRHRHPAQHPAGADEHHIPAPALGEQHRQRLTTQRMERMGHNDRIRNLTGRTRTTQWPSGCPDYGASPNRTASGSSVPAPATDGTSRPSTCARRSSRNPWTPPGTSTMATARRPSTPAVLAPGVAPHPGERHLQRRRVMHEVEQIIEPAARIGHRPTVKLGLHLRYPTAGSTPRSGSPIFTGASFGITTSCLRVIRCRPSPCARLSRPRTTTAAPPRPGPIGRRWTQPDRPRWQRGRRAGPGRFPCSLLSLSGGGAQLCPAASPRLRRSTSPWPPGDRTDARPGVPHHRNSARDGCAPQPAQSARLEPAPD